MPNQTHQSVLCTPACPGHLMTASSILGNRQLVARSDYCWAPKRTKSQWTSLQCVDWNDFEHEFRKDHTGEVDRPQSRAATEGLAMPMTILWALENLNSDDPWTKKETLNIHVRFPNHSPRLTD